MHYILRDKISFTNTVILAGIILLNEVVESKLINPFLNHDVPMIRIEDKGFYSKKEDIRAVINSVKKELWQFFPNYVLEPIVLEYGRHGPIVFFKRNYKGEIVIHLSAKKNYWSQYSYQFAHEFCHILCGFDNDAIDNVWFEETICETAALFTMKRMAYTWSITPPDPSWRYYSSELNQYVNNIIKKSEKNIKLDFNNLAVFYEKNKIKLKKNPHMRKINRSMSLVLLKLFEKKPYHWESIRWLNSSPSLKGETFSQYMYKWYNSVPSDHKEFVQQLIELYGLKHDQ